MSDPLRLLFEHLLYGVAHCRSHERADGLPDFVYLSANHAFELILGIPRLAGRRAREAEPPWPAELFSLIAQLRSGQRPGRTELHLPSRQRWVEVSVFEAGAPEFFLVIDDITTRKDSEADLRFHESLLEETGRIAKVGGWSFDPTTGAGFWTDEVARIHGLDPADPTDRDFALTFYTPESRPRIQQAIAEAVAHGTPYDLELELVTRGGLRKWVRTIGHPIVQDGRVVRMKGSFQDITDLKRTERRLATQNAVSDVLDEASSLHDAVPSLLRTLAASERWQFAVMYLVDESAGVLRYASAWFDPSVDGEPLVARARSLVFSQGEGLPGEVWASGVSDLRRLEVLEPQTRYPHVGELLRLGYRSQLTCPVVFAGRTVGVVLFLSTEVKEVDDQLRDTCAAVARQFGLFMERKRAEGALEQSEARHRMLVEQASDGIFVVGLDGRYQDVNSRYAEFLGLPRADFIGQPAGFGLSEADKARIADELVVLRETGLAVSEWQFIRADGRVIDFEVRASLLDTGRVMGIVRDITERKRSEAALQRRLELEAQLSRLAATVPGAIFSFRIRADGTPWIPSSSQQVTDLLGFPPEQLRADARPALDCLAPEDVEPFRRSMEESAGTLSLWTLEVRYRHPLKGLRWLLGRAMPTRDQDGVVWHGFMMDVTDRHELEDRFRQAQKMEAIGQLASGVAHDFNNLLTVIQGNAALLDEEPGVRHECVHEIAEAAERAAALTRQLLLFSRKQEMRAIDLDLNEVVGNVTKLLRRVVGEDITLVTEFSARPPIVHADVGMLEQVLLNLSVNSRDAMPDGGRLTVTTSVSLPDTDGRTWMRLRVADTGHGIAPEVLPRIFEPFFTTKDVGKGTGLGLATVYAIVKQHGGSIEAHSEIGRGTTFDIALPAGDEQHMLPAVAERDEGMPGGTETILVVEDEPSVRMLVSYLLEMSGYRVITAESGHVALRVFDSRRDDIDLLLTDMVMPDGVTGRELAEQLVARKPTLKVIYTSGYAPEIAAKGLSLVKGRNFIQKPYLPRELSHIVRSTLDQIPEH